MAPAPPAAVVDADRLGAGEAGGAAPERTGGARGRRAGPEGGVAVAGCGPVTRSTVSSEEKSTRGRMAINL